MEQSLVEYTLYRTGEDNEHEQKPRFSVRQKVGGTVIGLMVVGSAYLAGCGNNERTTTMPELPTTTSSAPEKPGSTTTELLIDTTTSSETVTTVERNYGISAEQDRVDIAKDFVDRINQAETFGMNEDVYKQFLADDSEVSQDYTAWASQYLANNAEYQSLIRAVFGDYEGSVGVESSVLSITKGSAGRIADYLWIKDNNRPGMPELKYSISYVKSRYLNDALLITTYENSNVPQTVLGEERPGAWVQRETDFDIQYSTGSDGMIIVNASQISIISTKTE